MYVITRQGAALTMGEGPPGSPVRRRPQFRKLRRHNGRSVIGGGGPLAV